MPGGGCGFGQFVAGSPVPGSSAYLWPASPSSEGLFEETPPQNKKKGMVAVSLSESPVSSSGIGGSLSGSIHDPLGAYSLTGMRTSQRKRVRRRSGKTPIKTRPRPWRPSPIVGMYSMASSIKKSIVGWRNGTAWWSLVVPLLGDPDPRVQLSGVHALDDRLRLGHPASPRAGVARLGSPGERGHSLVSCPRVSFVVFSFSFICLDGFCALSCRSTSLNQSSFLNPAEI